MYGVRSQLGSGTVNISPVQQGIQQAKSELKSEYGMSTRSLYGKSIKRKKTAKSESKKTGHQRRKTSSVTKKKIGIKRKEKRCFFITTMMYSSETDKSTLLVHTENVALFAKPPINTGEEKVMWVLHEPCFVSKEHYSSVQFYIPGTGTQYTDLSRTELYV